jgi:hypothetical protein
VTIQDLGSLGELIAAIATIATLAYLAVQIRQNTRALRHDSQKAILQRADAWRAQLIQDPEIAELYRKGLRDPKGLDPSDRLRFRMLLDTLFLGWLYIFQSGQLPGYDNDPYIRDTMALPGGKQYWADHKARFDTEFVRHVEALSRTDTEAS